MMSHPHCFCSAGIAGALSFHLRFLSALLLIVALSSGCARADDLEDCNGAVLEKIEPACTAVIDDASRPVDDRLKAYAGRARLQLSRSKWDLALNDAEAALQLNPRFVPALLVRGFLRHRSGSFDSARADLDLAIEIEPKNPFAFLSRGNLRNDQKAWADALADFNQALVLRQDLPAAHVGRARAFVETAELDQALAELNAALALNPNVPGAFFLRGLVYRRKGDVDHAIEDFSRAIAQAPQSERGSYFARAQLFTAKGDYARAIADFDRLLSLVPDNKEVQRQRQAAVAMQAELARVATGQPGATTAGATPAAPSQPPASGVASPNQQIDQARQLINQGNYAAAVERLNQVLATDPGNEKALGLRALTYSRLNRLAEARNDLDGLLKLRPDNAPLLAMRGLAEAGLRQFDQGMADVNRAIALDPNNAAAYLGRGERKDAAAIEGALAWRRKTPDVDVRHFADRAPAEHEPNAERRPAIGRFSRVKTAS